MTPIAPDLLPPTVGLADIADLLGVSRNTPNQWRHRGLLPPPMASGKPVWWRHAIIQWARDTGRWPPGSVGRPESRGPRQRPAKPPSPAANLGGFTTAEQRRAGIPAAVFVSPPDELAA